MIIAISITHVRNCIMRDTPIRYFKLLFRSNDARIAPNPRYFYGTGVRNNDTIVFVFDIIKDRVIREHVLVSTDGVQTRKGI